MKDKNKYSSSFSKWAIEQLLANSEKRRKDPKIAAFELEILKVTKETNVEDEDKIH